MKRYVIGIAFDDLGRVALIRKNRPQWQAGKWNGIGGHIESGEYSERAMEREFMEEAGLMIQGWRNIGALVFSEAVVDVFTITDRAVREARTVTDEEVRLFPRWKIPEHQLLLYNVPMLIELCAIQRPFTFQMEEP